MQQGAYLRILQHVIKIKNKILTKFKMPQIFSPIDIKIGLVFSAIVLTFMIIGALIWGWHPPIVGH